MISSGTEGKQTLISAFETGRVNGTKLILRGANIPGNFAFEFAASSPYSLLG
jgi:hypothetical protein